MVLGQLRPQKYVKVAAQSPMPPVEVEVDSALLFALAGDDIGTPVPYLGSIYSQPDSIGVLFLLKEGAGTRQPANTPSDVKVQVRNYPHSKGHFREMSVQYCFQKRFAAGNGHREVKALYCSILGPNTTSMFRAGRPNQEIAATTMTCQSSKEQAQRENPLQGRARVR